jgi:protein-S-isoprenylcysteine O-methyltransferase Ste14
MDTIESIIRWIGGLAALVVIIIVMISVLRFRSQPAGKTVGSSPARLYSPVFLMVGSLISIAICVLLWRPIPLILPPRAQVIALILGAVLYFSGIGLVLWGRQALGKYHNLSTTQGVQLFADHQLITNGPFAVVRHPMYLGFFLAVFGGLLLYQTWTMVLFALSSPVFVKRARREEEALIEVFGEEYRLYQQRVPAFFPRLFGRMREVQRRSTA